jgi:hypothetical protein
MSVVGLADAVVAHELIVAVAVRAAVVEASAVDAASAATLGIRLALGGLRGGIHAPAAIAGLAARAIRVAGAFVVADSVDARLVDATLGVGDANARDDLAGTGDAHLARFTVRGR